MNTTLKEQKVGNYNVEVKYDMDAESPRQWDELSVIYSNHRHIDPDNHSIEELFDNEGNINLEGKVGLAVWLFDHSGYTFKTAEIGASNPFGNGMYAQFDSGMFGVIAMPITEAKWRWGETDWEKMAKDYMREQISTYNSFANGSIYCFLVRGQNGNVEDSCGEFYNIDECLKEGVLAAKSINESDVNQIETICATKELGELKSKFYELAITAPSWVDELFELIDEEKARKWLIEKLKEFAEEGAKS